MVLQAVTVRGRHVPVHTVGDGPPLLCLHGGPGASHEYMAFGLSALASRHRLVFFDQPAIPRVNGGTMPELESLLAEIDGVCDALGLGSLGLVGHSWGAVLALLFSRATARCVSGVAMLNMVIPGPSACLTLLDYSVRRSTERGVAARIRSYDERISLCARQDEAAVLVFARDSAHLFNHPHNSHVLRPFMAPLDWQHDLWCQAELLLQQGPRLFPRAVVIQGEDDMFSIDSIGKWWDGSPDLSSHVLTGCAHVAPLEAPTVVCAHLVRFFSHSEQS